MGRARRERGSSSRLQRTYPNGLLISVEKSLPLNNVLPSRFLYIGEGVMKRCISWKPLQRIGVCIPERAKDVKRLAGIEEIEGERQEAHTWGRDKPAL